MRSREMLSYFGLSDVPFGKEIPTEALQLLPSVKKNLAAARLLVETKGIGVITGKAGTGNYVKRSVMQSRAANSLPSNQ